MFRCCLPSSNFTQTPVVGGDIEREQGLRRDVIDAECNLSQNAEVFVHDSVPDESLAERIAEKAGIMLPRSRSLSGEKGAVESECDRGSESIITVQRKLSERRLSINLLAGEDAEEIGPAQGLDVVAPEADASLEAKGSDQKFNDDLPVVQMEPGWEDALLEVQKDLGVLQRVDSDRELVEIQAVDVAWPEDELGDDEAENSVQFSEA